MIPAPMALREAIPSTEIAMPWFTLPASIDGERQAERGPAGQPRLAHQDGRSGTEFQRLAQSQSFRCSPRRQNSLLVEELSGLQDAQV